jgi:hypothetical protein
MVVVQSEALNAKVILDKICARLVCGTLLEPPDPDPAYKLVVGYIKECTILSVCACCGQHNVNRASLSSKRAAALVSMLAGHWLNPNCLPRARIRDDDWRGEKGRPKHSEHENVRWPVGREGSGGARRHCAARRRQTL